MKPAPLWAESVFHVLAHVDAGPIAPSCFNPVYIAWIADQLGSVDARPLAEDVRVLAAAASTHDVLSRVQAIAWVFETEKDVGRARDHELSELWRSPESEVDPPLDVAETNNSIWATPLQKEALSITLAAGAVAEVLRAAAELELPLLVSSFVSGGDREHGDSHRAAIDAAMKRVEVAAPTLVTKDVRTVRALGQRGRALGNSIFVGVPGIAGCPSDEHGGADHIAWQAAHEATVGEVMAAGDATTSFEDTERQALMLLRERANKAGLAESHAKWLAHLDLRGFELG